MPPDLKDPDGGERLSFDISSEAKFQREAAIRASARIAFHKSEGDAKLRRALMQRARATTRPFESGETVHYWNKPKDRRQGRWTGPAVIVGREGPNYWIAQGGRCRLTSPEHLRPSGPEESGEFLSMAGVKREVEPLLQEDLDNDEVYQSERDEDQALADEDDHSRGRRRDGRRPRVRRRRGRGPPERWRGAQRGRGRKFGGARRSCPGAG